MRRKLGLVLQLVFSVAAIALLVRMTNPAQALSALRQANPAWTGLAIATWAFIQVLCIVKWQWVNRIQGVRIPLGPLSSAYLVGMFFNTFLPSSFGGDAVRAYKLARYSGATGSSVGSVVVDRFLALHSLLVVSLAAVLFSPDMRQAVSPSLLAAILLAGSAPFAFPWLLEKPAFSRLRDRFPLLREAVATLGAPGVGAQTLRVWGLAIAIQYLNAVMHFFLILAIGRSVPLAYVLAFVPVMVLLTSLPLSVNGIGIRESSLVFFLGRVGVGSPEALAVGVLSLAMLLLAGAVGGGVHLLETLARPARKATGV
ncbi:MAG TPA: lysylphosphatidylglycerol synthase transmembrane domain-containing protein [Pantanalinema sp.]